MPRRAQTRLSVADSLTKNSARGIGVYMLRVTLPFNCLLKSAGCLKLHSRVGCSDFVQLHSSLARAPVKDTAKNFEDNLSAR